MFLFDIHMYNLISVFGSVLKEKIIGLSPPHQLLSIVLVYIINFKKIGIYPDLG